MRRDKISHLCVVINEMRFEVNGETKTKFEFKDMVGPSDHRFRRSNQKYEIQKLTVRYGLCTTRQRQAKAKRRQSVKVRRKMCVRSGAGLQLYLTISQMDSKKSSMSEMIKG